MDEMQWNEETPTLGAFLKSENATVMREEPCGITLVSGDIDAFQRAKKPKLKSLGLAEETPSDHYLVRISRDSALWVSPEPQLEKSGWQKGGYALAPNDDAWSILRISGAGAEEILRQALSSELSTQSKSASIHFAGQKSCLVKNEGDYLVFVPRPLQTYVWSWLRNGL